MSRGIADFFGMFDIGLKDAKIVWAVKANDPIEAIGMLVADLLQMKQEELELDTLWRVRICPDGLAEINDFTVPSKTGKLVDKIPQGDLPSWVQDAIAVLQIVDQGTVIEGVGRKMSDGLYYITERKHGD